MTVALVIPAKGTSTRVRNKNLYEVGGKSLVRLACEKALECKTVDSVYLDTEHEGIVQTCDDLRQRGLQVIARPPELATNFTGANELMQFALHSIPHCELLLQTFATSPLVSARTIDKCVELFLKHREEHDCFLTVTRVQEYFWDNGKPHNFDLEVLPNSFELKPLYMETHSLYGILSDSLLTTKRRVGESPMLIEIPKLESLDIDDYADLYVAERLIKSPCDSAGEVQIVTPHDFQQGPFSKGDPVN